MSELEPDVEELIKSKYSEEAIISIAISLKRIADAITTVPIMNVGPDEPIEFDQHGFIVRK